jgi:hypothetical protein
VLLHVYAPTPKAHAFGFEPEALFESRFSAQFDLAACA